MATITLNGTPLQTLGELPAVGQLAPDFTLTNTDLAEIPLKNYVNKNVILNIFPSVDTPTCSLSVKQFNSAAAQLNDTVVLCISADLPFALKRFCGAENLLNVSALSTFRHSDFGKTYGVMIQEGKLSGLLSRAVIIINKEGRVIYTEQVRELSQEPNYQAAIKALS
jgi:thioredoxin-dependent peroxiredoxin